MTDPIDVRVQRLRSVPLFAELGDDTLGRILDTVTESEVAAGHVLIAPNQAGAGLFVIESGTVVVERLDGNIELGPGEFLGELALLDDGAGHSARVRTVEPVRFLAIARDDFMELIESEPKAAVAMLRILARRLRTA
ncbi:MAG: cyclic nucleotide-binding domain-containing protein [Actinomycetota bacterium]|nr:cyclic nucleotide-binding domain-containing protein [Actinomycetota bacterium]